MREGKILFFTATITKWHHILKRDKYKQLIINTLEFLVSQQKIYVYGYVIMPNHIHLLWYIREPYMLFEIQRDFLKYTANAIRKDLKQNNPEELPLFVSKRKDRKYQFWQDRSYSNVLHNRKVIEQKLTYIHNNPLAKNWRLAETPEDYQFSSAKFYSGDESESRFITHYTLHS